MRKKIKRIFTILGITAMIFTVTACGNRMDTMQPAASYVADFFDIPDTVTEIERLLLKDDMAYLCCLEEDGTSYLAAMDIDDGKFLKQNLDLDASVSLLDFGFAPRAFGGSDTLATSYILSHTIRKIEETEGKFDAIFCGKQAIDGDTAQVGPEIAEHLGLPQVTYALEAEAEGNTFRGCIQLWRSRYFTWYSYGLSS